MAAEASTLLDQARAAYGRRAWADALDLLLRADRHAPLAPGDLERLAWSAGMLDRDTDMLAACEHLFNSHLEAKADERAAYWAFFHGFRLFALREVGRANAWLLRAQHLVDGLARECAVSGYLLLPAIHKQLSAGDDATAANRAAQALAIGERCAEPDLVALARCLLGRAWARQGQVEAGIAQLDEAMLVAISGAMSPVARGSSSDVLADRSQRARASAWPGNQTMSATRIGLGIRPS